LRGISPFRRAVWYDDPAMKFLRTPDTCFENLPGYAFEPHYVEVPDGEDGTLRVHFVDEGPRDAPVVLLLHGEPSWSYLYRKMIPPLVAAGLRAVAPDLVGFGKSDKPAARRDYTYARHVAWLWSTIEQIRLRDITLFCQDWGSLLGLRVAAEHPEHFARLAVGNGGLPTGDQKVPDAFRAWRTFSQETPTFPVGSIISGGCVAALTPEVVAAYDAPFPDEAYKEGAREFPLLVPITPDDPAAAANRAAWEVLKKWNKPLLTLFSDKDAITRGGQRFFQERVPGAKGQPHQNILDAGHFLQEDKGEELAAALVRFVSATSSNG
jgi:haloalkane dehalogenase